MAHVVIIGGGFAGLSAMSRLAGKEQDLEITLIDPRPAHNFLPLLPDIVGRNMPAEVMLYPYAQITSRYGIKHLQAEVTGISPDRNRVTTSDGEVHYDFLLISCGVETNYYDRNDLREKSLRLGNTCDGELIRDADKEGVKNFIICGGGYTGVEIATHLWRKHHKTSDVPQITLVDMADHLVPKTDPDFQNYVEKEVSGLGINIRTGTSVEKSEGKAIALENGETYENSCLIWTAGIRTPDFVQNLDLEMAPGGRLRADENLAVGDNIFVAGDACGYMHEGNPLRPGVQFSISQGHCAGHNILRRYRDEKLHPYRPWDPGYLIPMANNRACGIILGRKVYGRLPIFMHYSFCVLRSLGLDNRLGVMRHMRG